MTNRAVKESDYLNFDKRPARYIKKTQLTKGGDFLITITGHGMEPLFYDRDDVVVQYCDKIDVGEVGVFEVPNVGLVIRYKSHTGLHRFNRDCVDDNLSEDKVRLIGRVLCRITPDMDHTTEITKKLQGIERAQSLIRERKLKDHI